MAALENKWNCADFAITSNYIWLMKGLDVVRVFLCENVEELVKGAANIAFMHVCGFLFVH